MDVQLSLNRIKEKQIRPVLITRYARTAKQKTSGQ